MKKSARTKKRKQAQKEQTTKEIAYNVINRVSFLAKCRKDGAEKLEEIKIFKKQLAALENVHKVVFDPAGFNTQCKSRKSIEKAFFQYKNDFYIKALGLENIEERAEYILFTAINPYCDSLNQGSFEFEEYYYSLMSKLNKIIEEIPLPQRFQERADRSRKVKTPSEQEQQQ